MAAGAISLRKSHDIIILSFCNIVKGQANCIVELSANCLNYLLKVSIYKNLLQVVQSTIRHEMNLSQ